MVPKPKRKAPSSPQKKKGERAAKSKRTQMPPKIPSPHMQLLGHDETEPSLLEVMNMLNSISAQLADHDVRFCEIDISREAQQVPDTPHVADNRPPDT